MWNENEKRMIWALAKTQYINDFAWKRKIPDDVRKIVVNMEENSKTGMNETFLDGLWKLYVKNYSPIKHIIVELYVTGRGLSLASKMFNMEEDDVFDELYEFINNAWINFFQEVHENYIANSIWKRETITLPQQRTDVRHTA